MKQPIGGIEVDFPYSPYAPQLALMSKIIKSLQTKNKAEHALLESPTGTGKSLSLLCASLAWQNHAKKELVENWKRAFYDSNVPIALPIANSSDNQISENSPNLINRLTIAQKKIVRDVQELLAKGYILKAERQILENYFILNKANNPTPTASKDFVQQILNPEEEEKQRPYPLIFYGTRTHTQIKQVIRELKKTSYRPKMLVLGSREHLCINPSVMSKPNKNEECQNLLDFNRCIYFSKHNDLADHPDLRPGGSLEVYDIEDIVELGKNQVACPYFASRDRLATADIVFCPYNYLIDPIIREAMDIELANAVVIIDEAHNIEDTCREAASKTLKKDDIASAVEELEKLIRNGILQEQHGVIKELLVDVLTFIDSQKLESSEDRDTKQKIISGEDVHKEFLAKVGVSDATDFARKLTVYNKVISYANQLKNKKKDPHVLSSYAQKLIEAFFVTFEFMFSEGKKFLKDYHIVVNSQVKKLRNNSTKVEVTVHFWAMNPAIAFHHLKQNCHSIILTSGTLSPMDSFQSELNCNFPITLEAQHVIDAKNQILVHSISVGPNGKKMLSTYRELQSTDFQDSLGELILRYFTVIDYGVLIFFPSYSTMDVLKKRWEQTGLWAKMDKVKHLFCEPRAGGAEDFKKLISEYYSTISGIELRKKSGGYTGKSGAAFFAICRGKVSEGLDFADNRARGVIVVGIPFPNLKDTQVDLKKQYNEARSKVYSSDVVARCLSGNKWYELQAYRALNQAIGRCIRHRYDFGAILLVDERFKQQNTINCLSKWLRGSIKHKDSFEESIKEVREFFDRLRAHPPQPDTTNGSSTVSMDEPTVDIDETNSLESSSSSATSSLASQQPSSSSSSSLKPTSSPASLTQRPLTSFIKPVPPKKDQKSSDVSNVQIKQEKDTSTKLQPLVRTEVTDEEDEDVIQMTQNYTSKYFSPPKPTAHSLSTSDNMLDEHSATTCKYCGTNFLNENEYTTVNVSSKPYLLNVLHQVSKSNDLTNVYQVNFSQLTQDLQTIIQNEKQVPPLMHANVATENIPISHGSDFEKTTLICSGYIPSDGMVYLFIPCEACLKTEKQVRLFGAYVAATSADSTPFSNSVLFFPNAVNLGVKQETQQQEDSVVSNSKKRKQISIK